jgi:hypothetical protein
VRRCVRPDGDLGNIDIGTKVSVHVDLTTATEVFKTDCGKGDGRGRAYHVNLLSPMELDFMCTQTGDQVLQISSQLGPLDLCDAHVTTCADPAVLPSGCNFGVPSMQPGSYYILVQAFAAGKEGTVDLTLRGVIPTHPRDLQQRHRRRRRRRHRLQRPQVRHRPELRLLALPA